MILPGLCWKCEPYVINEMPGVASIVIHTYWIMVQFIWPLKTIPCLLYCYKQHWCFTFTYCHLWLKQKCFKHTLAFKPSIVSWCKCAKNMVSCFCNATQFSTSILASNAKMPNLWCMAPPCCYHYKNQISKRSKNCQSKLLLAGILLTGLVLAAIQLFFGGGPGPILTFGISTMLTSSKILSIFTLLLFKLLNVVPKHISSPLPSTLPLTAGIEILIFLLSHGLQ